MLRDFLLAAGVKPADLVEAVGESRQFVRRVARFAGLAVRASGAIGLKARKGSKLQALAVKGVVVARNVQSGAEKLGGK